MRWFFVILVALFTSVVTADDLVVVKLSSGQNVAVRMAGGEVAVLGLFDSVTVMESDPTIPPPLTTKLTRAIYVYEKDQGAVPPQVAGALNAINKQALRDGSGFVATEFEEDTLDGTGQVPDQFKIAKETASKAGLPCLVVLAGDKIVRVVKAPKTAREVEEAVKQ